MLARFGVATVVGIVASSVSFTLAQQAQPPTLSAQQQLVVADKTQFDQAAAAYKAVKQFVLSQLQATPEYLSAKADLDTKAAARASARAGGDPEAVLSASTAYSAAAAKLKGLEESALSASPACRAAHAQLCLAQAAFEAVSPDAPAIDASGQPGNPLALLSPSQQQLAQAVSRGRIPQLTAQSLAVGQVGRILDTATVVSAMPPSDALVKVGRVLVRLSEFPITADEKSQEIALPQVFVVAGTKGLLASYGQRRAFVLEPLDLTGVGEAAEYLYRQHAPKTASAANVRHYQSLEMMYNQVPSDAMLTDASQFGTLRAQLRDQWMEQNLAGSTIQFDAVFGGADLSGAVSLTARYVDAGNTHRTLQVQGRAASLASIEDFKPGNEVRVSGTIASWSPTQLSLTNLALNRFTSENGVSGGNAASSYAGGSSTISTSHNQSIGPNSVRHAYVSGNPTISTR